MNRAVRGWIVAAALAAVAAYAGGCGPSSPRFGASGGGAAGSGLSREALRVGPGPDAPHELTGVASYYADEFDGRTTSNGEVYDMGAMTAAHKTLPFGTRVRVTSLDNGKAVEVRINDRGPFKEGRIIDLSLAAGREIALVGPGTARVTMEILEWGAWSPPTR